MTNALDAEVFSQSSTTNAFCVELLDFTSAANAFYVELLDFTGIANGFCVELLEDCLRSDGQRKAFRKKILKFRRVAMGAF